jgi:hypothetical protein
MLQSCLGIDFDLDRAQVSLDQPTLPPFLDKVVLRDLKIGDTLIRGHASSIGRACGRRRPRSEEIRRHPDAAASGKAEDDSLQKLCRRKVLEPDRASGTCSGQVNSRARN